MQLLLSLWVLAATPAWAESGADVLMEGLTQGTIQQKAVRYAPATQTDSFQQMLAAQIQNGENLPFDVRVWAQNVVAGDFAKAAHLWTALQPQISDSFRPTADAVNIYLLWKLGLAQTFFSQWIKALSNPEYAKSPAEMGLESVVTPQLDSWLIAHAIALTPEQLTIVDKLPANKQFLVTIKAWGARRDASKIKPLLSALYPENKLRLALAQTLAVDAVKKNDLKGAARILKAYVEPSIEIEGNPQRLAEHDLAVARVLFQAGQLPAAAEFYQKIPNSSPLFLESREELAWVYLRLGDTVHLRGELKALSSPLFKDQFMPEAYVVRAVSDLKMCYYDLLQRDLNEFSQLNGGWAKAIDGALALANPPAPKVLDSYSREAEASLGQLQAELKRVEDFAQQSIAATLPAVGPQKHWQDYKGELTASLEEAQKRQNGEYRRQWRNQHTTLAEAIRKMRFVRVEYLSQVAALANQADLNQNRVADNAANSAAVLKNSKDQLSFPISSELWPDELFKLRSAAQAQCLKRGGLK